MSVGEAGRGGVNLGELPIWLVIRLRNSDRGRALCKRRGTRCAWVTEMRRLNWLTWIFIAAALCVLLTPALPYLRKIVIGLAAVSA